jgi:chaperonin GroES
VAKSKTKVKAKLNVKAKSKKTSPAKNKVKSKAKSTVKAAKKSAIKKSAAKKTAASKKTAQKGKTASKKALKVSSTKSVAKGTQPKTSQTTQAKVVPNAKKLSEQKSSQASSVSLKPLDDRIVVEIATLEKKTAGGLYIPETSTLSGNFQGKVLAVGHGHRNKKGKLRPLAVKVGDQIMFSEHAGDKINIQGKDVLILRESEILGIVQK